MEFNIIFVELHFLFLLNLKQPGLRDLWQGNEAKLTYSKFLV